MQLNGLKVVLPTLMQKHWQLTTVFKSKDELILLMRNLNCTKGYLNGLKSC